MKEFNLKLQQQFDKMMTAGKLFRSKLSGNDIWNIYLSSFKPEDDPVFRDPNSSVHNCNHCNNFIRRYGNIVSIDDNYKIVTLFDFEIEGEYESVVKELRSAIKSCVIENVFFETFDELNSLPYEKCSKRNDVFQLGIDKNVKRYTKAEAELYGVVQPDELRTFNHMHLSLSKDYVDMGTSSIESIMGKYRDDKNVFQRAMKEISLDTLMLVKDLINQGSLLDGTTHLHKIEAILKLKIVYDRDLIESQRDNWCWLQSYNFPFAKFRNELIGVLCKELSEGEELNSACQNWNKRVDPANYMKAVAPITKRQIEEAKKFVEENGYEASFDRRLATIDDIKASEIKHMNVGEGKLKSVSIFDDVKSTKSQHKRNQFEGVEEVSIDKFMKDILPGCSSIEAFLDNKHEFNMVTLTTSNNPDSKPIFKWNNNYSWTFNGNLAGKSQIKEAVKSQGGKVDGVLRFSIMWSENNTDNSDLDAHCIEPNRNEIYFSSKHSPYSGGNLDIDITQPMSHKSYSKKDVVENITFPNLSKMKDGEYFFFVRQFAERGSKGFRAEIEFNGELFEYSYPNYIPNKNDIKVATVTLKNGEFTIVHHLPSSTSSKEIYGLESKQFHKVNLICLSPNHWGDNNVGNKHYFFMLDKCEVKNDIRGFHNENLLPDLAKHRKVLEVLGNTSMISPSGKQLSGLGFNSTVKDELIVKLSGNFKRMVKIKF